MNSLLSIGMFLGSLCFLHQDPSPESEQSKARLRAAMVATGLAFEESKSGLSLTATFDHDGTRKQVVYIGLDPSRSSGLVLHNVYTTVWVSKDGPPDLATMQRVFALPKKLGAFYLFTDKQGVWSIRFGVQFDATDLPESIQSEHPRSKELDSLVRFVDLVGEETDASLNGDKDVR
ncbi:MAG: hypothetical protein ABL997_06290 [Planctomycetota bacterium]